MLIDTHCHLTSPELVGRIDAVLQQAADAGVTRVIHVATNPADARSALALMETRATIDLAVGIHPHEAGRCDEEDFAALEALLAGEGVAPSMRERIVAVGETGLDFHYDFAPRDRQEVVFRRQLDLALRHQRPVVIHARESESRVCDILAEYPALAGRVVFHCFSAGMDIARRVMDLGLFVSYTGVATYRNADAIRETARYVPADRLFVETDAPYLSPEPVRKIRPNEPAFVAHTARAIAALRGTSVEQFADETTRSATRFFRLREIVT